MLCTAKRSLCFLMIHILFNYCPIVITLHCQAIAVFFDDSYSI
ncbi:hypothetical protein [Okeania sp. SIO3B5]|nr:hypothetical protein [Okeania sp. SIO3B5]